MHSSFLGSGSDGFCDIVRLLKPADRSGGLMALSRSYSGGGCWYSGGGDEFEEDVLLRSASARASFSLFEEKIFDNLLGIMDDAVGYLGVVSHEVQVGVR